MGELTLFYYFHLATFLAYVCSVMEALLTGILWFNYTREILELKPTHQDYRLYLSSSMSMFFLQVFQKCG